MMQLARRRPDGDAAPLGFVVALVNGWASSPRRAAHEETNPYPEFSRTARNHGFVLPRGIRQPPQADLIAVADELYEVFTAKNDAVALRRLNHLLERTAPIPRLLRTGPALTAGWSVPAGAQGLLALCVVALYRFVVANGDNRRLGVCGADACADAYVDQSPTALKRFCTVGCQTRMRVSAFRARNAHRQLRGAPRRQGTAG